MKALYFDCNAGISGDMIVGACIDAGVDFQILNSYLSTLDLGEFSISYNDIIKNSIRATKFNVNVPHSHHHRHLPDIKRIISNSKLPDKVKEDSIKVFELLAEAEGSVHGISEDEVHFHEVGAVDSIIDIVSSLLSFYLLEVEVFYSSQVPTGSGYVQSMHGKIPVPAPATVELLKDVPVFSNGICDEVTTPTGAAILKYLVSEYGEIPQIKINSIGYGAGDKNFDIPNILRIVIGDVYENGNHSAMYDSDKILKIETCIDDMNPEFFEHIFKKLFSAGALDVYIIPIIMKKSRPAHELSVILNPEDCDKIMDIIFRETTTSGLRKTVYDRFKLNRRVINIKIENSSINVKVHTIGDSIVTVSPEYEDCLKAAEELKMPLKDIYEKAKQLAIINSNKNKINTILELPLIYPI
jgi:uncharacterized protein (TIGR00299 family) protein